ncbi:MAG: type I-U CRISPR-associated protein Csx17 [Planctomycetota bacterium]|nr:type I-U CRISPR-associated protein Csx17 [Planctomycetota bacterium]
MNRIDMNRIELAGCRPDPLMSYLKALGILRILTSQKDPLARGAWVDGLFVLTSSLTKEEVLQFLLEEYQPTPITSPWNGGSGYYPTLAEILCQIRDSKSPRLEPFRQTIQSAMDVIDSLGLVEKPQPGEQKQQLLQKLRVKMPECFLPWMDAAVVLQQDSFSGPPLLGSGGNDGRLEFSVNFMNRLISLGFQQPRLETKAKSYLANSLFGTPCADLGDMAVGQFNPGRAGGPNNTQGFEGNSLDNPFDFLFMMEGVVLFTGTAARKLASQDYSVSKFPFTMQSVAAEASVEAADTREAKGELWLPLWSSAASLTEISYLLNEGRADFGDKAARSGVDFARAIASLGVDRGIDAFQRMGFLKRNGLSILVTPLGLFPVREQKEVDLIRELDRWFYPLRKLAQDDKSPTRFATALKGWDTSVMAYCRQGGSARFSDLITALGDIFSCLAKGPKYRENFRGLPRLSPLWLTAADDNTPEYRLARSLAGMYDPNLKIGPMALHALPLKYSTGKADWSTGFPLDYTWTAGPLAQNLALVLKRRLIDAQRKNMELLPLATFFPAALDDVMLFLAGSTDDERLERLMRGMLAIRQQWEPQNLPGKEGNKDLNDIPFAFSMIRPLFASKVFEIHGTEIPSKPQSEVLVSLMAADLPKALDLASRRFRHLGLTPLGSSRTGKHSSYSDVAGVNPLRLAASCLFGLSSRDLNGLLYRVVRVPKEQLHTIPGEV